ncbi:MAG: tRNA epoxyqueuosine(34) reductase QueG [Ignavibacteria bacterium]
MPITNEIVTERAKALGFDLVGFARADILSDEVEKLESWLKNGYNAGMEYMEKNIDRRKDIGKILPGAMSVISLAINYYSQEKYSGDAENGKISRYAYNKDYHLIIRKKLEKLIAELRTIDQEFFATPYIDTGPVMDKVWAKRAGLGWIGKHTNLITTELGSWVFLATIITNREFNYGRQTSDHCGSCSRCIDACPTNAIIDEYIVDANRCISYLTIENKGEIAPEFKGKFQGWLFGCDICQEVCPWNIKLASGTNELLFCATNGNKELLLDKVLEMENIEFKRVFKDSPLLRARLKGLKRNASFLKP